MGIGVGPGSTRRYGSGDQGTAETGIEALERYGYGEKDPVTGLYEGYDLPAGHPAGQSGDQVTVSWVEIFGQWPALVADFASEYRIRLDRESDSTLSWAAFRVYVQGLMSADSRLTRHFTPDRG